MECPGKYDDIRTFRIGFCNFNSVFISFSATIYKHSLFMFTTYRNAFIHFCSKFNISIMSYDIKHTMEIFFCLFADCFSNFRMSMANIKYANPTNPVQETISVQIFNDSALRFFHNNRISAMDCIRRFNSALLNDLCAFRTGNSTGDDFRQFVC